MGSGLVRRLTTMMVLGVFRTVLDNAVFDGVCVGGHLS